MYIDRVGGGVGSSRSEMVAGRGRGPLDWKWIINNALDKHLEKSLLSTSRVGSGINSSSKDKERISVPSTSTDKSQQHQHQQLNHRDSHSTSLSKNNCSDGMCFMYIKFWTLCVCAFFIWVYWVLVVSICCFCF